MYTDIDGTTQEEKQRHTKEAFAATTGDVYQCTHCDIERFVYDHPDFETCKRNRHEIMKFHRETDEEIKERKRKEKEKQEYQNLALYVMNEYTCKTLDKTHEILYYEDGVYHYGAEQKISQYIRMIEPKSTRHDIAEVTAIVRDKTGYWKPDEFDADPMMVNVRNGLVCIRTGDLLEHSPEYLSRVQLPIDYDKTVIAKRFLRFIGTAHNDPKDIYRIFEMMGACLIRDNRWLTKAWMHLGAGSNGKSRLFDILGAVLGEPNITSHSIHDIEKNRFALASLDGKLANICGDIEKDELSKTGNLKKVIGGDMMPAEKKFMADYNFRPFCKLIFSANELPQTTDESDGFARRFEIVEWTRQFYGKDRDYTVFTIMDDPVELTGIFNIMVAHAVTLLRTRHLKYEGTVDEMKSTWKERSNSVEKFVKSECHEGGEYEVERSRLYSEYVSYCKINNLTRDSDKKFAENIKKLGVLKIDTKRHGENFHGWKGICLRKDLQKDGQAVL